MYVSLFSRVADVANLAGNGGDVSETEYAVR